MVGFPIGVPFVTAIVSLQYLDISVIRRYRLSTRSTMLQVLSNSVPWPDKALNPPS